MTAAQQNPASGTDRPALSQRLRQGSVITILGFGGAQALRLCSNLVLTRLLMPEAFGLMSLVTVLLVGLKLFSDIGLGQSILRSPRGDDPVFLDTAWSLEVIRGFALWLIACLLAWPVARFYELPGLVAILQVSAIILAITGFEPTRVDTAARHLQLGRVTIFDLSSQIVATAVMIILAYATGSVWSLVLGQLVGAVLRLWLMSTRLPGHTNRFRIEGRAAHELISFGKWIFISTVAGFLVSQGDKLVLSTFLSLEMLGIYNIGYTLASVPLMLGSALVGRMMIPLYREHLAGDSANDPAILRRFRFLLTGGLLAISMVLALGGIAVIGLLYDPRYQQAGAVVCLLSLAFMPQLIVISYDQIALALGDSRRFFWLTAARGIIFVICIATMAGMWGLKGAIFGQGVAFVLCYPLTATFAHRYGVWDPIHDLFMGLVMVVSGIMTFSLHLSAINALSS